jgi:hypothetical protein
MIRLRSTTRADVAYVCAHLRDRDRQEIADGWGYSDANVEAGIWFHVEHSYRVITLADAERVYCVAGVVKSEGYPDRIWVVGSLHIDAAPLAFARATRRNFPKFLEGPAVVVVAADDAKALHWAQWMGGNLGPPVPFGNAGRLFRACEFRRAA